MAAPKPPRIITSDSSIRDESSDDHFSSASEGASAPHSPIPTTRVERVDDIAAHGEVPGTPAYEMRLTDAVPDEIEVVPEGQRSRSGTRSRAMSNLSATSPASNSRPTTPGGTLIPRTVVERVDDKPAHGEVEGTPARELRLADAEPDEIRRAPDVARANLEGSDQQDDRVVDPQSQQEWFRSMWEGKTDGENDATNGHEDVEEEEDGSGDDFDEFAEEGADDDFGDFDEAGEQEDAEESSALHDPPTTMRTPGPDILAGLPHLDLSSCKHPDEIQEAIAPYINAILPNSEPVMNKSRTPALDASNTSPFLSDRSLSLWQQLVSPPPMQPPDWTRSKIRRLFLVSLGVPVDLDEILPPSKQKRLILPNVNFEKTSPRASSAISRLKDDGANDSSTSIDSKGQTKPSKSRRAVPKGPPPPPEFDTNAASLLSSTTQEAMSVYSDQELQDHVMTLQVLNERASRVLEHWLQRKDEGLREKEALEGVIENLVGFVKGRRGK